MLFRSCMLAVVTLSATTADYHLDSVYVNKTIVGNDSNHINDMAYTNQVLIFLDNDSLSPKLHYYYATTGTLMASEDVPGGTGLSVTATDGGIPYFTEGKNGLTGCLQLYAFQGDTVAQVANSGAGNNTILALSNVTFDYVRTYGSVNSGTGYVASASVSGGDKIAIWPCTSGNISSTAVQSPIIIDSIRGGTASAGADLHFYGTNSLWISGANQKPMQVLVNTSSLTHVSTDLNVAEAPVGGLAYFTMDSKEYVVVPTSAYGAFKIYDVTAGPAAAVLVGTKSTNLGSTTSTSSHVAFQATVVSDTAFIYTFVPNIGLSCYKFYNSASTIPVNITLETTYDTIQVYTTGFESTQGFTANTTYNQPLAYYGPDTTQWGVFFGCPSTTAPLSGSQSMQMRWYSATSDSLGYTFTNFNTDSVAFVKFLAASTNGLNMNVQYSYGGSSSYGSDSMITLTGSSASYNYNLHHHNLHDVRVKFTVAVPSTAPTSTSRVYLDNVQFFKIRQTTSVYTPVITPSSQTIEDSISVTITCATEGADIYYTTNGDDPTDTSTVYTGAFIVPKATTTVKAIAMMSGVANSSIATEIYTYVPENKVHTPVITRATGDYEETFITMIMCDTEGADIYYTLDGTTPSATSTLYQGMVTITGTCTLSAIAIKEGMLDSDVATAVYTFPVVTEVDDIASLYQVAVDSSYYKLVNGVTVVYQNFKSVYVHDSSGWLLLFGDSVDSYTNGDVLTGVIGEYVTYQNNGQLIDLTMPTATEGTPVDPVVKNIQSIAVQDIYMYVKIENVEVVNALTFSTSATTSGTVKDGAHTLTVRNNFRIAGTYKAGDIVTIVGFVSVYNNAVQVYPVSMVVTAGVGVDDVDLGNIYVKDAVVYVPATLGEEIEVFNVTGQRLLQVKADQSVMPLNGLPQDQILLIRVGDITNNVVVK